ncbi:MAG TPA: hypothetical protein VHA34_18250 [Actinomycetes bacterium]|nr:hypothetical protein [Actinomycetes bacterium]
MDAPEAGYQLGSDAVELERLNRQGMVLAPATRMILQAAGIGLGMRVLDLGSGTGDVAFVAAELVGPAGEVVGEVHGPLPPGAVQAGGLPWQRSVVEEVRRDEQPPAEVAV